MQTKSKVSAAVGTSVAAGIIAIALVVGDGSNAHRSEHSAHPTALPVSRDLASSYRFLTSASSTRRPAGLVRGVSGVPGGSVVVSPGRGAGAIGRERLGWCPASPKAALKSMLEAARAGLRR